MHRSVLHNLHATHAAHLGTGFGELIVKLIDEGKLDLLNSITIE